MKVYMYDRDKNSSSKSVIRAILVIMAIIGFVMLSYSLSTIGRDADRVISLYVGFILFLGGVSGFFHSKRGAVVGFFLGFIMIQFIAFMMEGEPMDSFSIFFRGLLFGGIGAISGYVTGGFMEKVDPKIRPSPIEREQSHERYCPECGTSVINEGLYCPNCGRSLDDDKRYMRCFEDTSMSPQIKKPQDPPLNDEKSGNKQIIYCNICGKQIESSEMKRCNCGIDYHQDCLLDGGRCPTCGLVYEKSEQDDETLGSEEDDEEIIMDEEKQEYMKKLNEWRDLGFDVKDLEQHLTEDRMDRFKEEFIDMKEQIEG